MFEKSMLYIPYDIESRVLRAKGFRVLCLFHLGLSHLDQALEYINEAEKVLLVVLQAGLLVFLVNRTYLQIMPISVKVNLPVIFAFWQLKPHISSVFLEVFSLSLIYTHMHNTDTHILTFETCFASYCCIYCYKFHCYIHVRSLQKVLITSFKKFDIS